MPNRPQRYVYHTLLRCVGLIFLAAGFSGFSGCHNSEITSVPVETELRLDGERINTFYTNEEIAYLLDVGLWHDSSLTAPALRRWVNNIRVGTKGTATPEDIATLRDVVSELNGLTRHFSITVDPEKPNLIVYFIPRAAFGFIREDYPYPNPGFASVSHTVFLQDAAVLVAIDSTSQSDRDGLIYRGLAASLGLTTPSSKYPESIFNAIQNPIPTPRFTSMDRAVIELLYSSELWPGMKRDDVIRALTNR